MSCQNIDSHTVKYWIEREDAILIDVREPAEHASAKIVGSLLRPLGGIKKEDIPVTSKKVVVYCQKGLRGKQACEKVQAPDAEIYNLDGGLADWIQQGYPTESSGKQVLPLDRQVQLTVGFTVLTCSLLAQFVHPAFLWVCAFFGAGLFFAGASGTCALGRVLAAMPWNK